MRVMIERSDEVRELEAASVAELLRVLGFAAEEVLVVRNGLLVTEDESLSPADEVRVLSVISGG